jgi:serine/threonine protein kinase
MEYMPGGSLRDRIRASGPLSVPEALRATRHAATGAAALAEIGWVHRNINPGCVLYTADGRAKLGDFFFARQGVDPVSREASVSGDPDFAPDPAYQSPECVTGEPRLTPACDVYSLGATLYEALTGRPPIDPTGPTTDLTRRVLNTTIVPPRDVNPSIPAAVSDVVCRALAKDPGARFSTPAEFARAVNKLEV